MKFFFLLLFFGDGSAGEILIEKIGRALSDVHTVLNKADLLAKRELIRAHDEEIADSFALSPQQQLRLERLDNEVVNHIERGETIDTINAKSGIRELLYQGDIVLTTEQVEELVGELGDRRKRQASRDIPGYPSRKWPNGRVPYSFAPRTSPRFRELFKKGANLWQKDTCLQFYEDYYARERIELIYDVGCYSFVGNNHQIQPLSLGRGCDTIGIAAHEIGHSLGFFHTHARHDRDQYVFIHTNRIKPQDLTQFKKESPYTNDNFGIPYDYGSNLHYGSKSFIYDWLRDRPNAHSMVPVDALYIDTLGSPFLSFYDLLMMNTLYGCLDKCRQRQRSPEQIEIERYPPFMGPRGFPGGFGGFGGPPPGFIGGGGFPGGFGGFGPAGIGFPGFDQMISNIFGGSTDWMNLPGMGGFLPGWLPCWGWDSPGPCGTSTTITPIRPVTSGPPAPSIPGPTYSRANCKMGGFPHPRDCSKCICPGGYGGRLCEKKPEGRGRVLRASTNFQQLADEVGYRQVTRTDQKDEYLWAYYWIQAPQGRKIEVKFNYFSESVATEGCHWAGVEIKTQRDQRLTGYRQDDMEHSLAEPMNNLSDLDERQRSDAITTRTSFGEHLVNRSRIFEYYRAIDDVCQLLVPMGLDKYVPEFTINKINGAKFLDLDETKLKAVGIQNPSDRSLIKKKVKMIKNRIERERKIFEKESRTRVITQGMHIQM